MTEGQGKLCQIELDIVLREHDLLGETSEEVTAAEKVENQVKFTLGLKIKSSECRHNKFANFYEYAPT